MPYEFRDGQWLRPEEKGGKRYMGLRSYWMAGNKLGSEDCINALQVRLRRLLENYLNAYGDVRRGWARPLLGGPQSATLTNLLNDIRRLFDEVAESAEVEELFIGIEESSSVSQQQLADFIGVAYALWDVSRQRLSLKGELYETIPIPPIDLKDFDAPREKPIRTLIQRIQSEARPYFSIALVHGSLATRDTTGYSDADIWLVCRKDTLYDKTALQAAQALLRELAHYLYLYDPTQHHGFMIVNELDLDYYPPLFLPPEVFTHARVIYGPPDGLSLSLRPDQAECEETFWATVQLFRREYQQGWRRQDLFRLKYFSSCLQLFPCQYLQILGQHINKRASFEVAHNSLGDIGWEAIDTATRIRQNWQPHTTRLYRFLWQLLRLSGLDARAIQLFIRKLEHRIIPNRMRPASIAPDTDFLKSTILLAENSVDQLRRQGKLDL